MAATEEIRRMLTIINRAHYEFDYEIDPSDSMEEICLGAEELIKEVTEVEVIDECDVTIYSIHQHYDYDDGNITYTSDGQIVDFNNVKWYRKDNHQQFVEISESEHTTEDYFVVDTIINSEGKKVLLLGY